MIYRYNKRIGIIIVLQRTVEQFLGRHSGIFHITKRKLFLLRAMEEVEKS